MSQEISSLHKILKDETRQKILTLLNEKGSLGYTELLDTTKLVSTGLLNYHLKVLGNLVTKNESGQYLLTEKGKLASKLLEEFPEVEYQSKRRKRQKQFWTLAAFSQIVYLITVLTLYYINFLDFGEVIASAIWFVGTMFLAYLGYGLQNKPPSQGTKEEMKNFKIAYVMLGSVISLALAFFGTPILSYLSVSSGGPNYLKLIDNYVFEYVTILFASVVLGSISGYYFGKRHCFQQPKWGKWLEEHFSL